jgi:hypothetical protein
MHGSSEVLFRLSPEISHTLALTRYDLAQGGRPAPPCPWAVGQWWKWGNAQRDPAGQTAHANHYDDQQCWVDTMEQVVGPEEREKQ